MEFTRNMRDENFVRGGGQNWLQGLSECTTLEGCAVDPTDTTGNRIVRCSVANDDCLLWQNQGTANPALDGLYGHPNNRGGGGSTSGWARTIFHRKVCIVAVNSAAPCAGAVGNDLRDAAEVKVNVILSWRVGAFGSRAMILQSSLFNWYSQ